MGVPEEIVCNTNVRLLLMFRGQVCGASVFGRGSFSPTGRHNTEEEAVVGYDRDQDIDVHLR